ncbi:cellulase family glycosylhydrolase [Cupriavidus sp. 8B]
MPPNAMRQPGRILLATLLLTACARPDIAAVQAPRSGVVETGAASRISHVGRWLVDAKGRVRIVHGVNVVVKHPPYAPAAMGFGTKEMDGLAREGFNGVRLGVVHAALEPQPGVSDDGYLASLQATQQRLAARGVFTLIDMHQDGYSRQYADPRRLLQMAEGDTGAAEVNNGFAGWMSPDHGLPNENPGHPYYYMTSQAINRAFDDLYANAQGPAGSGLADQFATTWRRVAQAFAGKPGVLGYELLNEPWPGTGWPTCASVQGCPGFDRDVMTPFHQRLLRSIRQVDTDTLVFQEPNPLFNVGVSTHVDKLDGRSGFAFHNYAYKSDRLFQALGARPGHSALAAAVAPLIRGTPAEREARVFANAEAHTRATGDALLMTEFGGIDAPDGNLQTVGRMVAAADDAMMPWFYWRYPVPADSSRASWEDLLDVLVRPYPQAVAGTPQSWRFDRSNRVFTLGYATQPVGAALQPGALTQVFVPERHYPHGYRVEVSGAIVRSAPNARHLRLAAEDGASEVTVRILPLP